MKSMLKGLAVWSCASLVSGHFLEPLWDNKIKMNRLKILECTADLARYERRCPYVSTIYEDAIRERRNRLRHYTDLLLEPMAFVLFPFHRLGRSGWCPAMKPQ